MPLGSHSYLSLRIARASWIAGQQKMLLFNRGVHHVYVVPKNKRLVCSWTTPRWCVKSPKWGINESSLHMEVPKNPNPILHLLIFCIPCFTINLPTKRGLVGACPLYETNPDHLHSLAGNQHKLWCGKPNAETSTNRPPVYPQLVEPLAKAHLTGLQRLVLPGKAHVHFWPNSELGTSITWLVMYDVSPF